MVKIQSGGGINSNKVVQSRSGVKVEPVSKPGNVAGVAQQGLATAFRKEPITQGQGYTPGTMPTTGIKGIYNSATSGPGSGRTIYASGSQSQTPSAREMPPGRDTLAEYGPDSPTARGRR
jgi:hypothetical protein